MRILILGGTTEASTLASMLAGDARFAPLLSLAGVTRAPAPSPVPRRIGGFGGAEGLTRFLEESRIAALVDATHPFAGRITAHAHRAADRAGVALLRLRRPPWPEEGSEIVPDMREAAACLGPRALRVLLTIGRLDLAPFGAPHRYWVRSVDPPPPEMLPDGATVITARGPFGFAAERALFEALGIEVLVTKNAGGEAISAKLDAARVCGARIVMVARPPEPDPPALAETAHQAFAWLESRLASPRGA